MKKTLLIITMLLCLLGGCVGQKKEYVPKEDEIVFRVNVDASDIYGIGCSYGRGDDLLGGQIGVYADGTKIHRNDNMDIVLEKRNFPEDMDYSRFTIIFSVLPKSGTDDGQLNVGDKFAFAVEYGKVYEFLLSGDGENGYTIKRLEK